MRNKKLKGNISDIAREQLYVQCDECDKFLPLDDEENIEVDEWGNAYCLECAKNYYEEDEDDEDDDDYYYDDDEDEDDEDDWL